MFRSRLRDWVTVVPWALPAPILAVFLIAVLGGRDRNATADSAGQASSTGRIRVLADPVRLRIEEAPIASNNKAYLFGIASGPGGYLWVGDQGCMNLGSCSVVRLDPSRRTGMRRIHLTPGEIPYGIAVGPGGDVWVAEEGDHPGIARVTLSGRLTEYTRGLVRGSQPFDITRGPDGAMWFTDQGPRPSIGRISGRGRIIEFSRGLKPESVPFGIAAGSKGLWFTDRACSVGGHCALGRVRPDGRISESSSGLRAGSEPLGITAGSGGAAWFADGGASGAIGHITASGRISEFTAGLNRASKPVALAAGPDGTVWFADEGQTPAVGRLDLAAPSAGRPPGRPIREYSARLLPGSQPAQMAAGSGRTFWFTDEGAITALGVVLTGRSHVRLPLDRSPLSA